ncbi:MAG: ATP-binding protein [Bacteroidales bacterium]|nr:ATP-binding protein [Bacteroidales bacterium]
MKSQFEFGKVISDASFVDREDERRRLAANIESAINTILISPRRWGKTSLIAQVARENKNEKTVFCFLDLFNIRTEEEFYQKLATQIIKSTSNKWEEWVETGRKFLKSLIPRFSIGDDPLHDFSISLDIVALKQSAEEILNLSEKIAKEKEIRLVVCIDEFQNISFFDQPLAFQKQLRSYWQHHQQTCYIIYGSKKHIMAELFQSPEMPFYRFGDLMMLQKIEKEYWIPFIIEGFKNTGKEIKAEVAALIPEMMENHPYYVQFLSYQSWNQTDSECDFHTIEHACAELLNQQTILYQHEVDNLTNFQLNYLKAIANGEKQLNAAVVVKKYNLGTPGNIKKMQVALENKEIIDVSGKTVEISDPLFRLWIRKYFL